MLFSIPNEHLDIQDDENITIYISAEKYKFGYYNWSSTFNISSDEVYRIPFAFNTNMVYIEITISYSDNTLPGSLLVCEIEAIGMWNNGNHSNMVLTKTYFNNISVFKN